MDLGITPKVKPLIEAVRKMIEEDIKPQEDCYFDEVGKCGNIGTSRDSQRIFSQIKSPWRRFAGNTITSPWARTAFR